jgi:dienelactone hydrolase
MSIIAELKRRKVFRVAGGYMVSSWVLIQVVETVFPAFGFDDAAFRMLVLTLAAGFFPVVALAWAFEITRSGVRVDRGPSNADSDEGRLDRPPSVRQLLRYPRFVVPVIALLGVLVMGVVILVPAWTQARWAHREALPQIADLVDDDDFSTAFALASEAERLIPGNPTLADLWSRFSVQFAIETEPSGATVSYRLYEEPEQPWVELGVTPLEPVRLPRSAIAFRFEKTGHPVTERNLETIDGTLTVQLANPNRSDAFVQVPAMQKFFLLTGFQDLNYEVPDYRIQRHEVTNAEYLEFVAAGGYENPDFWRDLIFEFDGQPLSVEQALERFKDPTGRFGPATWTGGNYPDGTANLPVSGISWFEAVAYARFRGMMLPTLRHWSAAAIFPAFEEQRQDYLQQSLNGQFRGLMMARSNFVGKGPVPVGSLANEGPFGTHDMSGNAREWIWNSTGPEASSERYILGGSWQDPSYLFTYAITLSPWDRSVTNGFRLIDPLEPAIDASLTAPVPRPEREVIPPVPDEIYAVYAAFYDYDRTALNAQVESVDDRSRLWRQETVSIDATYGDERVQVHLFIPKNARPPYQPVIYFPASNAIHSRSSDDLQLMVTDFIIQSGRALIYPVLWGTHERNVGLATTWPDDSRAYSDKVMRWIQDMRRTIDYATTRDDLDLSRLGYYGWSWGGWNGPIVMALDDRIRAGVYVSGGIPPTVARPEASSASFASRVSAPVLMISGRHDVLRPVETFQAPMFESLGTPPGRKRHAILEGGHAPPRNQLVRETLDWFDTYLGPVE